MQSNAGWMCVAMLLAFAAPAQADTRTDYLLHCSGCHLSDGSGTPHDVPTLRNNLGRIVELAEGRGYLVRVPGSSQAMLDDAGLAAVINWVLTEFNSATLADDFEPLTAEEVKEARSNVLMDPIKFRVALWQASIVSSDSAP
jgi:mono/diheme cytochrome c family protein